MKITAGRADRFAKSPDPAIRVVLVYGPDRGLMRERSASIAKASVEDVNDPFAVENFLGADLVKEPTKLTDSCNAISLMGGKRLVRVKEAMDALAISLKDYLTAANPDCMLILEAGDLTPRSALRKLCEGAQNAAALPCYVEGEQDLARVIGGALSEAGMMVDQEAVAWLAHHLTGDRGLARAAIEKLITYMGEEKRVTLAHAEDCIGDAASASTEDVSMACFSGQTAAMDENLSRLLAEKTGPVAILRAVSNHARRLAQAQSMMEDGMNAESAMAKLQPPVFWKQKKGFSDQLTRWDAPRLLRARDVLMQAEAQCKQTGMPDTTLCHRALIVVSRLAGIRKRGLLGR